MWMVRAERGGNEIDVYLTDGRVGFFDTLLGARPPNEGTRTATEALLANPAGRRVK